MKVTENLTRMKLYIYTAYFRPEAAPKERLVIRYITFNHFVQKVVQEKFE